MKKTARRNMYAGDNRHRRSVCGRECASMCSRVLRGQRGCYVSMFNKGRGGANCHPLWCVRTNVRRGGSANCTPGGCTTNAKDGTLPWCHPMCSGICRARNSRCHARGRTNGAGDVCPNMCSGICRARHSRCHARGRTNGAGDVFLNGRVRCHGSPRTSRRHARGRGCVNRL